MSKSIVSIFFFITSILSFRKLYAQDSLGNAVLMPYQSSFVYNYYKEEYQYYKVKFTFNGSLLKNGNFKGTLRLGEGLLHMDGNFKPTEYYGFMPDKTKQTKLYSNGDSSIFIEAYFNGYYTLSVGKGTYNYKGKKYRFLVMDDIGIWSRPGIDIFTNSYFLAFFDYYTKGGTLDNANEIQLNRLSYTVWYKSEVLKENIIVKAPETPIKIDTKPKYYEALLNLTANQFVKSLPNGNQTLIEQIDYEINGVSTFQKTIYPKLNATENYSVVVLVPEEYAINMVVEANRTFKMNGEVYNDKIQTPVVKINLGNNIVGFRKLIGLPKKVDSYDFSKFSFSIYRSANTASVPIKIIISKMK